MTVWQALILGILQGLTEFLPVSSSGHLILASRLMGIQPSVSMELALHAATLFAVALYYRKQLFGLVRRPLSAKSLYLLCATCVTVLLALVLKPAVEQIQDGKALPFCFMATAAVLLIGQNAPECKKRGFWSCLFVGAAQGIAVVPGLSRSGFTITAGILAGENRETAAENSFLLSVPIIAGAFAADIISSPVLSVQPAALAAGMAAAFIFGLISIKAVEILSKKASLTPFAVYLALLSALISALRFFGI